MTGLHTILVSISENPGLLPSLAFASAMFLLAFRVMPKRGMSRQILLLSLTNDPNEVRRIVTEWNRRRGWKVWATTQVLLDFLFIPVYTATIAVACLYELHHGYAELWLVSVALAQVLVFLLDCAENFWLIRYLLGDISDRAPKWCSVIVQFKLGLIAVGVTTGLLAVAAPR